MSETGRDALAPGVVIAALVTPYSRYGGIDTEGMGCLVEHALAGGVAGLLVNGEIGEGAHLSRGERLFVIEAALEAAAGRAPVYAATGAAGGEETLALTRDAAKAGVAAAVIAPPHYYPLPEPALLGHYREMARRGRIPILVANMPASGRNSLQPSTLATLAETPNVAGIVQGHPDSGYLPETLRLIGDHCPVLSGDDRQTYPALCAGVTGLVSALAGVVPQIVVALAAACHVGDHASARVIWLQVQALARFLDEPGRAVAACKAALDFLGLPGGAPRRPLPDLPAKEQAAVDDALAALDRSPVGPADTTPTAPAGSVVA